MIKNKGSILEIVVGIIEKALETNSETKISLRSKQLDRHGKMREHDVYVETNVNGKLLRYSFECKYFGPSSSVKMSHISEYYDKIQETGIKGFFISTGKFQKSALQKAKNVGIDVFAIIEPTKENNITLEKVKLGVEFGQKFFTLLPKHKELIQHGVKHFYYGLSKVEIETNNYINSILIPQLKLYVQRSYENIFANFLDDLEKSINERRTESTIVLLDTKNTTYYNFNGEFYPLVGAGSLLLLSCEMIQKFNLPQRTVLNLSNGTELVNYWSHPFGKQDVCIVQTKSGNIKIFVCDMNDFDSNKTQDLGFIPITINKH